MMKRTTVLLWAGSLLLALRAVFLNVRLELSSGSTGTRVPRAEESPVVELKRPPRVILHVGPHKTGTSTIQQLTRTRRVQEFLEMDSVSVPSYSDIPGRYENIPDFNFAHCMLSKYHHDNGGMGPKFCTTRTIPALKRYLKTKFEQGQDVLIVAEDLSREKIDVQRIQESLRPYNDVVVVTVYRRLADWFPSWYSETIRLYGKSKLVDYSKFRGMVEWFDHKNYSGSKMHTHSLVQKQKFQENSHGGIAVKVMHMHREEPLLENFFCTVMDGTFPNTCEGFRNGSLQEIKARPSWKGIEICRWVLLSGNVKTFSKMTRCIKKAGKIARKLAQQNKSVVDVFPIVRPPPSTIEWLWNYTLEAESEFRHLLTENQRDSPSFWEDLRKEFNHTIDTKWFSIDINKTGIEHDALLRPDIPKETA